MAIASKPDLKTDADKKVDTPFFSKGGSVIDLVKSLKYFGVQLDSSVDWNQYIKILCSKVS